MSFKRAFEKGINIKEIAGGESESQERDYDFDPADFFDLDEQLSLLKQYEGVDFRKAVTALSVMFPDTDFESFYSLWKLTAGDMSEPDIWLSCRLVYPEKINELPVDEAWQESKERGEEIIEQIKAQGAQSYGHFWPKLSATLRKMKLTKPELDPLDSLNGKLFKEDLVKNQLQALAELKEEGELGEYLEMAVIMRMIFSVKREDVLDKNIWKKLKDSLQRSDPKNIDTLSLAFAMMVLSADEVEIKEDGLKLSRQKKELDREAPDLPEAKKF
ncbi:hypothetical protein ACFL0Z_01575 [Patescibacteria group bacterium]